MADRTFKRKRKEERPVVAICYDFDKTLSPDDMQAQGYIQSVGFEVSDFWKKSNSLADENEMDQNLAWMYTMKQESEGKLIFTKEKFADYGSKIKLFPGVDEWFGRIRTYGESVGIIVEHYIISSGLKEMIEGTSIAKAFEKIYASSFYYNEKGVAVWPAQVINFTNKTQFLFRIKKGALDINDPAVNESFSPEEERIPFSNMIYIGDSDTDIPCMKLVNSYGGHSIGVYNVESNDKTKVYKMIRDERIKYFVPADYSEDSELDVLVKTIINRTAKNEELNSLNYKYKAEQIEADKRSNERERKRKELLIALKDSPNFKTTHSLISELQKIDDWSPDEMDDLFKIAMDNSQVRTILHDPDIETFYRELLKITRTLSENAQNVKNILDNDD